MATQDLSAMFQNMGAPNPQLAQMMGVQPPPDLQQEQPDIGTPPPPQLPGGLAPPDPLDTQIKTLSEQIAQGVNKIKQPISDALPDALKDFDKYNEQRYQQAYGGHGVLGTAGRALANLLSGYTHGGQTIKERLTEENRKDWDASLKAAQVKIQQEKSDQLAAIQQQAQQLQLLKTEQMMKQQAAQTAVAQQNADTRAQGTPDAKDAVEKARRQSIIQHYIDIGQPLTDEVEKSFRATGKFPTATAPKPIPGVALGSDIKRFHPDAQSGDTSLDDAKYYRAIDRNGKLDYEPTTPPGYMVPQTTTAERAVTVGNEVKAVPFSSTRGPAGATPAQSAPGGARTLGVSGSEQKRAEEPTYTPSGQKALSEVQPVKSMLESAKEMLEPIKDTNQPLEYAVQRLGYSVGMASDASKLINKLELEKIIGAARVLKGSSRAITALQQAAVHLPDPKKDSAKLMYEKINTVLENLNDIEGAVNQYERRYPGRKDTKPDDITAPPKKESVEERRKRLNY